MSAIFLIGFFPGSAGESVPALDESAAVVAGDRLAVQ
jgi:hypothetical protein